ncbi:MULTISPECIES: CpsD/CapB family tyrosine-protein kinase [Pseudomonas]|uniref:non-specific protein-tyrosine kinase n=1 Tax=Pseudomonas auratipiscis TaxID=3115853 RepID=A0AB35WPE2_9PSED|nr:MULTISPECIES: CpsD/CapB family tyrosine-protein kinase [unclassified Pseudomonas]MEE1865980.1 CpsD/CapB family tyrosine-protein kinase [Pseudomonas sp. 120P]MEE1956851.1 CpsD/CapB family tyrosine-protein kinase [Pseudomonas sp. 119P]
MDRITPAFGKNILQVAPGSGEAPQAAPVAEQPEALGQFDYVQTKVVPLRADHLERNRIVAFNKNSNMSSSFDLLRTQVLQAMEENGWRTLAITSPTPEAGKTVLAINLAMSIAHHTTKTALLVDFDLRRPRVGASLGLPMEKSLNELLAHEAWLEEVMVNPTLPRFVVLPTREPIAHSTEMLSSPKVSNLISELRDRYESRICIFDLPPLLSSDDAITILPKFDCVLLVVANGDNNKKEIEDCMYHLATANLIGAVLNKADTQVRSYY